MNKPGFGILISDFPPLSLILLALLLVLAAGCRLHCAVEGFVLGDEADIERWENVLQTAEICRNLKYQEIEQWLV